MARSLQEFLTDRLGAAYRQLLRSLSGLTPEQAAEGGAPHWRRYRYGEGLDGSIAGLVLHLAVWKHSSAAGLESGRFPDVRTLLPENDSWEARLDLLGTGQARLLAAAAALTEADLDRKVVWEGYEMSIEKVVAHLIEHDHYHAGQVNLLRQQRGHELTD